MTNWGPSGLAMPGQSFADSKRDGSVSAASLRELEAALNGSRRVYLQGPKVGHGCALPMPLTPATLDRLWPLRSPLSRRWARFAQQDTHL